MWSVFNRISILAFDLTHFQIDLLFFIETINTINENGRGSIFHKLLTILAKQVLQLKRSVKLISMLSHKRTTEV